MRPQDPKPDEPPSAELRLSVLQDFAPVLSEPRSLESLLWTLCRRAIAPLGFEDCIVYLIDPTSRRLVQRAAVGPKNPTAEEILNPIEIPIGSGIVGHVAAVGKPEIVVDTRDDPRYILDDAFRLSELTVPIIDRGKVLGVLDSEHPNRDHYRQHHLDTLATLASMVAPKIAQLLRDTHNAPVADDDSDYTKFQYGTLELLVGDHGPALGSQSEIMGILSHELRTPLNGILSLASFLTETLPEDDEESRDSLEIIERSSLRLLQVNDALLNLPASVHRSGSLCIETLDLSQIVESVCLESQKRRASASVEMKLDIPPGIELQKTDRIRLSQILAHLVENAIKFTPQGTVRVSIHTDSEGTPDRIDIADTGIGIEAADQARIFEPFYQVDRSHSRRYDGLGLGLTLVEALCKWMGYRVEVRSELDEGSTFSLHLGRVNPSLAL